MATYVCSDDAEISHERGPSPNLKKTSVVVALAVVTVLSIVRGGAKDDIIVGVDLGNVTITGIIDKTISSDFVGLHDNGLHVA